MEKLKLAKYAVAKSILCLMIVGSMAASTGMSAFAAGNYHDSRYATRYSGDGSDVVTPKRAKQDNTKSYIYNDKSDYYFSYVNVVGCNATGNGEWCTNEYDTYVAKGKSKKIGNTVHKDGYKYARLAVNPGPQKEQYVSFLWSPDSI